MIRVSEPDLSQLERDYLTAAYDSTWISSHGAFLDRFEADFGHRCGGAEAVAVSNGTVALHLLLVALGVGPGDEVIVPDLTYVATANAVLYCGATPVLVDVSYEDWCLDAEAARAAITPATVGIISVDLYGHPCRYDRMRKLADSNSVWWVSDSAEGLFSRDEGEMVNLIADAASYSFFGNKVLTCGEGGAIVTRHAAIARRARQLRTHNVPKGGSYDHEGLGFNYRLTNLQAAILVGQLERSDDLIARRQSVFQAYRDALENVEVVTQQPLRAGVTMSPWLFTVLLQDVTTTQRAWIISRLAELGVETRPSFTPLHKLPHLGAAANDFPVSIAVGDAGLSLPTHPHLTGEHISEVVAALVQVVNESRQVALAGERA